MAPVRLVHSAVVFAGHVIEGAVVSRTITAKVHDELLAVVAWSLAVHVTLVVPIGKIVAEAGAQLTVGVASHASVAVGVV